MFWSERFDDKRKPKIHAIEVLINEVDYPFKTLTFELRNFEDHLNSDANNYGDVINVSAGNDYLIINWEHFSDMKVYLMCGVN